MELADIRREYTKGGLRRKDLKENPIDQFNLWLEQAIRANLSDPTAMTVATVDENGMPFQRIVLLKSVDQNGFVFYTNLGSRKAQHLDHNTKISLHFPGIHLSAKCTLPYGGEVDGDGKPEIFHLAPQREPTGGDCQPSE